LGNFAEPEFLVTGTKKKKINFFFIYFFNKKNIYLNKKNNQKKLNLSNDSKIFSLYEANPLFFY
jgi:hypothetical protein